MSDQTQEPEETTQEDAVTSEEIETNQTEDSDSGEETTEVDAEDSGDGSSGEDDDSEDSSDSESEDDDTDEASESGSEEENKSKFGFDAVIGQGKMQNTKQDPNAGRNWYVIHTYSGYEDSVRLSMLQRIESMNMQDKIFNVVVPKETQIVMKKGQPKTEKKRLFPGYVLVDMIVTDDSWYVVRNTPNVTGFVGAGTIPVPVSGDEWNVVRRHMGEADPKFKIDLQENDHVMVLDGPFANYDGVIKTVDNEKGKVKVLITIFGRETPVELDFTQVKKKV